MAPSTLFRLAGMALIAALPLSVPGYVIHPQTHEVADVVGSTTSLSHAIVAVGWALVLLGLPGLYAIHAQRSGVLGLAGDIAWDPRAGAEGRTADEGVERARQVLGAR